MGHMVLGERKSGDRICGPPVLPSAHSLPEFLQPVWYQLICLRAAFLAFAPDALVRADARAPALLASAPLALVLADARAPALLAFAVTVLNSLSFRREGFVY